MTKALTEIHRRYTTRINREKEWRGFLWQGRYFSSPLDSMHYENALRYVELNPVRANLCLTANDYPWSSARTSGRVNGFHGADTGFSAIRKMTSSGRPIGSEGFRQKIIELYGIDRSRRKWVNENAAELFILLNPLIRRFVNQLRITN